MKEMLVKLWVREEGITTVEYAVAGGLITVAIIAAINLLSNSIDSIITGIAALLP